MSKVWLITGASRGLGYSILEAVLQHGDRVLATARDISQFDILKGSFPDQLQTFELDVTHEQQAQQAVKSAIDYFGRLDVLVNNAGYGFIQPFEYTASEEFRAQIETNLFGVVNMTRAAIPYMREQDGGVILQISSAGGRLSSPGLSAYQAAKWAVGGFSDVVAKEVAAFGIKVCTLEPGGMRTDWGHQARSSIDVVPPLYQASLSDFKNFIDAYAGQEVGDPERIAKIIIQLTDQKTLPARLLLGSDAFQYVIAAENERNSIQQDWKAVSLATDFDAVMPVFP